VLLVITVFIAGHDLELGLGLASFCYFFLI
jgi:hypothetical protein